MKKQFISRGIIHTFLIIGIFLFTIGCEKDDDSPKITNVNGDWSGKTSQNENITFTVTTNSVTEFTIKVVTPSFTAETSVWPANCKVADNSFSLSGGGTPTLNVSGEFKSNTSSKGTFNLGSTSGTWTATKQ